MNAKAITHMVIFSLKHPVGSAEAGAFLEDGRRLLAVIPTVKNFKVSSQVSPKNDYDYCFSMDFEDMESYATYSNHPTHVAFVEERWKTEVTKFLEIDLKTI